MHSIRTWEWVRLSRCPSQCKHRELGHLPKPNTLPWFLRFSSIQWMSEIQTSLDFRQLSCVPFPDRPNFRHCLKSGHFFCLKLGQKSWDTSLGHFKIKQYYDPKFPKRPGIVCPDFRQLGCPNFEHKSRNLMPEIGTLKCPNSNTVWNQDVPISDIQCTIIVEKSCRKTLKTDANSSCFVHHAARCVLAALHSSFQCKTSSNYF